VFRPAALLLVLAAPAAMAQEVIRLDEHLDDDRPEAWAMNYFTSVTLLSGLSVPHTRRSGSMEVAAELGWIPHLGTEERTVGFNGTKEEDLNHSPVFARPRLTVGLPWRMALTLSWVPPVRIAELKPQLFAFALERPLYEREPVSVGARFYAQVGATEGPITCSGDVVRYPPGSPENLYGCEEESNDRASQRYVGLELSGAWRLGRFGGLTPWASVAANFLDNRVQVDALTYGFRDRSVLDSETWTFATSAGVSIPVSGRFRFSVGVFYSPLEVLRAPYDAKDNDPLFNVRGMISCEFQ
jgi:hypothetical protein